MGKTRGGRNTKLMALTDARGRAMVLKLVEGQSYEGSHVVGMLPAGAKLIIVGDKGFDSDSLRRKLEALGHQTSIAAWSTRKTKVPFQKRYYQSAIASNSLLPIETLGVGPPAETDWRSIS